MSSKVFFLLGNEIKCLEGDIIKETKEKIVIRIEHKEYHINKRFWINTETGLSEEKSEQINFSEIDIDRIVTEHPSSTKGRIKVIEAVIQNLRGSSEDGAASLDDIISSAKSKYR